MAVVALAEVLISGAGTIKHGMAYLSRPVAAIVFKVA